MKIIIPIVVTAFVWTGCFSAGKLQKNVTPGAIPDDIKKGNQVLLVQKQEDGWANHQNKLTAKVLKKHYKASFELADSMSIVKDARYANTDIYRYMLKQNPVPGIFIKGVGSEKNIIQHDIIIYDRKEKKELPSTGLTAHNFAQGVMFFAKAARNK